MLKEKRNYKFTVVKSAKLLTVHQEGLLTLWSSLAR